MANALQDMPKFGMTLAWLAYLVALIGAHIKWVRPQFRRYPWVAPYAEVLQRAEKLKARHPKLVQKALVRRLLRSSYRIGFFLAILPFFIGMYQLHGHHFVWFTMGWVVAGFGITVGYHRCGTHPSFKTSKVMRGILLGMGSLAMQGPAGEWMKKHSKHHAFGETSADVHTPYVFEESKRAIVWEQFMGFMHSFVMWAFREPSLRRPKGMSIEQWKEHMLAHPPSVETFRFREEDRDHWEVRNDKGEIIVSTETLIKKRWAHFVNNIVAIEKDPVATFVSHPLVYLGILSLGFLIPWYFGGITFLECLGRIWYMNWATFCVNSVCHLWGEKPFETPDNARNNAVVEILALGEGGHNTHHKSELWARHGVFGWQFDPSYVFIKTLAFFGLAKDLNLPTKYQIVSAWTKWRKREPWMQGYALRPKDIIGKLPAEKVEAGV
jgi:stearoyl-CoA desaturase (Delta-9 desaturase)